MKKLQSYDILWGVIPVGATDLAFCIGDFQDPVYS